MSHFNSKLNLVFSAQEKAARRELKAAGFGFDPSENMQMLHGKHCVRFDEDCCYSYTGKPMPVVDEVLKRHGFSLVETSSPARRGTQYISYTTTAPKPKLSGFVPQSSNLNGMTEKEVIAVIETLPGFRPDRTDNFSHGYYHRASVAPRITKAQERDFAAKLKKLGFKPYAGGKHNGSGYVDGHHNRVVPHFNTVDGETNLPVDGTVNFLLPAHHAITVIEY